MFKQLVCTVLLLVASTIYGQLLGDFGSCGNERVFANANNNHQHEVVYNSVNNEYFVAWIEAVEGGGPAETSVVARRFDSEGKPIGGKIPVYPYGIDSNGKHNPYVAYNPRRNLYTVLFEYDFAEGDVDIYGSVILANGTILGYFPVAATVGVDDRPSLAYNVDQDEFLFTFENDIFNNATNATTHYLLVGRMNGYGVPLPTNGYDALNPFPYLTIIQVASHDSHPNVAYDRDRKQYLLSFSVLSSQPPLKIVVGTFVDSLGLVNPNGTVIGSLALRNGTRVSCHNPQVRYAPKQRYFFVIYEVDINGNEAYLTDVIASPVDSITGGNYGFITLSGNLPRNRNPSFDYAERTDDFLVTFEADNPGSNQFNIRGTVIAASTFVRHTEIVYVNRETSVEHHPQVAYNSKEGKFIAVWNAGDEPDDNLRRDVQTSPAFQREDFVEHGAKEYNVEVVMPENVEYSPEKREVKTFNFPKTPIHPLPMESSSVKRQAAVSPLKGTILCASSSTTLGADMDSKSGDNNGTVIAISVVVAIFGVAIIVLAGVLIYMFVIKPRRQQSREKAVYKFDPEN